MDRLLLRPDEAAALLGVGRSTMYALLARGEIPTVRLGHAVRVPAAALAAWIDRQLAQQERGT